MHTLLFLTITKKYCKWVPKKRESWTVFNYDHVGSTWASSDHEYSPDKDAFDHCYDELEVGHAYLILTTKVDLPADVIGGQSYDRWVWSGAMELTEAQLKKVHHYFIKVKKDIRRTVAYAEQLKYPRIDVEKFGVTF